MFRTHRRIIQPGRYRFGVVDLTIFKGDFSSDGWAFAQHVFAGIDLKLTRNFGLVLEGLAAKLGP